MNKGGTPDKIPRKFSKQFLKEFLEKIRSYYLEKFIEKFPGWSSESISGTICIRFFFRGYR